MELNRTLSKEPVSIHYRRIEIKPFVISKGIVDYYSSNLFPDNIIPSRVICVFVDSKAHIGNRHLNPYDFQRSWVSDGIGFDQLNDEISREELKRFYEQKLSSIEQNIEKKLDFLLKTFTENQPVPSTSKTTRGGKRKCTQKTQENVESAASGQESRSGTPIKYQRLQNYLHDVRATSAIRRGSLQSSSVQNDLDYDPDPPPPSPPPTVEGLKVFIQSMELLLNGSPIDQFPSSASSDDFASMYFRLQYFSGFLNSMFTNGISPDDFLNGYFFSLWDLR